LRCIEDVTIVATKRREVPDVQGIDAIEILLHGRRLNESVIQRPAKRGRRISSQYEVG